jgi:hypothetical protein
MTLPADSTRSTSGWYACGTSSLTDRKQPAALGEAATTRNAANQEEELSSLPSNIMIVVGRQRYRKLPPGLFEKI